MEGGDGLKRPFTNLEIAEWKRFLDIHKWPLAKVINFINDERKFFTGNLWFKHNYENKEIYSFININELVEKLKKEGNTNFYLFRLARSEPGVALTVVKEIIEPNGSKVSSTVNRLPKLETAIIPCLQ